MVTQLQQALHPGAPSVLPGGFSKDAAQQAASRFPLDAGSPLQLRDLRVPANRTLPSALNAPPPEQDGDGKPIDGEVEEIGRVRSATEDEAGLLGDGRAGGRGNGLNGGTAWHDAAEKWERAAASSESGSSTQAAVWLQVPKAGSSSSSSRSSMDNDKDDPNLEPPAESRLSILRNN